MDTKKIKKILSMCDHTLLSPTATSAEIFALCDEGIKYGTASVCIPPHYVDMAKRYVMDRLNVCTVIGFPNGYQTTKTKLFETANAIENGADEIDMVINLALLKESAYDPSLVSNIESEIREIKNVCGKKILKVIVETCLLNEKEKKLMCEVVADSGADYIKTSTGFSTGGATFEDVALFKKIAGDRIKIKASGGISTLEDAEKFIKLGADRLGTSKIVKLAKNIIIV